jgi:hypothetical protein
MFEGTAHEAAATVTSACPLPGPPGPTHETWYDVVPTVLSVTTLLPDVAAAAPSQSVVHDVASVEDQEIVELAGHERDDGLASTVTVGGEHIGHRTNMHHY